MVTVKQGKRGFEKRGGPITSHLVVAQKNPEADAARKRREKGLMLEDMKRKRRGGTKGTLYSLL